jgi:hypothetical protein
MKFESVIPYLRDGQRVRRAAWPATAWIQIDKSGLILNEKGDKYESLSLTLKHSDWEMFLSVPATYKRYWRWLVKDSHDGTMWLTESYYDDRGRDTEGLPVIHEDDLISKVEQFYIDLEV